MGTDAGVPGDAVAVAEVAVTVIVGVAGGVITVLSSVHAAAPTIIIAAAT
ncbi:MAG: hypothetical protein ABI852_05510 [Gemmatimonadaceae bacterium]